MSSSSPAAPAPRCADFARSQQLDPIGTAGSHPSVVVVEIQLPWPREITDHPLIAPAAAALQTARARVQAVAPTSGGQPGVRRLIHYRRPSGPFRAYTRTELSVTREELPALLAGLATRDTDPRCHDAAADGGRDVLVCTHGRRDACCGTLGTQLVAGIEGRAGFGGGVRLWRTSHTGGHRFAPTALVLPEGTAWAYLEADLLHGIVARSLDVKVAAAHYRGCIGLDHPAVQASDRAGLQRLGWAWLDGQRSGEILAWRDDRTLVRLAHHAIDGTRCALEAVVETARRVPVPDCRSPIDAATKDAPELRVVSCTIL